LKGEEKNEKKKAKTHRGTVNGEGNEREKKKKEVKSARALPATGRANVTGQAKVE
jgi:hypothetical protein